VRRAGPLLLLLLSALTGCKKGPSGGMDGGAKDGGAGDGARDGSTDGRGDGGGDGGPMACNGRCVGTCRGVCTGICSQRTDDGECAGRCEETCVGTCEGTCPRPGGDGGARDAASERPRDGSVSDVTVVPEDPGTPRDGRWLNRTNTGTLSWPPAGHSGAMVYDWGRRKVMMFGGGASPGNATWEWDGDMGSWELRQQMAGTRPSRRYGHAMAYDDSRGVVVLYGGIDESGGSNAEVWEWNGDAGTWTQKNPGPAPSRWGHAMSYDPDAQRIIMFGGSYRHRTLGDGDLFDIWEYDGAADSWVNKTYPLPPAWPRARRGHALAYDAVHAVTVLYGGEVQALGGAVSDVWEWDNTSNLFTDRTPAVRPAQWPGPRAWHGMASLADKVVLFGGATRPSLWAWDGDNWTLINPVSPSPPLRDRSPLAWDSDRNVMIVSGGSMTVGTNALADLWEWAAPAPPPPPDGGVRDGGGD
jgi:modification target Cys-rich repeat protein